MKLLNDLRDYPDSDDINKMYFAEQTSLNRLYIGTYLKNVDVAFNDQLIIPYSVELVSNFGLYVTLYSLERDFVFDAQKLKLFIHKLLKIKTSTNYTLIDNNFVIQLVSNMKLHYTHKNVDGSFTEKFFYRHIYKLMYEIVQ